MTDYLDEAAALLRKAAVDNEKERISSGFSRAFDTIIEGRERIAMKFAQLAAIEKGLVPKEMADEFVAGVTRNGWSS